jgi:hypothetical protein
MNKSDAVVGAGQENIGVTNCLPRETYPSQIQIKKKGRSLATC